MEMEMEKRSERTTKLEKLEKLSRTPLCCQRQIEFVEKLSKICLQNGCDLNSCDLVFHCFLVICEERRKLASFFTHPRATDQCFYGWDKCYHPNEPNKGA